MATVRNDPFTTMANNLEYYATLPHKFQITGIHRPLLFSIRRVIKFLFGNRKWLRRNWRNRCEVSTAMLANLGLKFRKLGTIGTLFNGMLL
jgi:hypothetical protein